MNKRYEYIYDTEYNIRKILDNKTKKIYVDIIDLLNDYACQQEKIKFYIEQSDIKDMLWGKEILKIIGDEK